MKRSLWLAVCLLVAWAGVLLLLNDGRTPAAPKEDVKPPVANPSKSAAYEWLDVALEATAREHERHGARPTIGSRMLAIIVTCMYDAWAAYDDKAVGTRLGDKLRRPSTERTIANKEKAIAYSTYRAMLYLFPDDAKWLAQQMTDHGLDPKDDSTDLATPQGVGNAAAAAVIAYRRNDGANQHGDEVGSTRGPYSDFTYYRPVNPPDKIIDPDRWQPIPFDDGKGGKVTLGFLTAHWYRVQPFALKRSDMFRPGPPPRPTPSSSRRKWTRCWSTTPRSSPSRRRLSNSCAMGRNRPANRGTGSGSRRTCPGATRTTSTGT